MKDSVRKKELQSQYKEREVAGGVYLIRNTANNKVLLDCAVNLQGSKNRFEFAQKTGSCVYVKLQKDWSGGGGGQFVFETLEELAKGDNQSQAEYKEDIALLMDMWREKLADEDFY